MSVTYPEVIQAGQQGGIPSADLPYWAAIIQQESGGSFDAYANSAGAVGPAQKVGYPLPTPGQNLDQWAQGDLLAGAQEFASDIHSFPGSIPAAIASYYTGAGNVQKYGISSGYGNPTPAAYTASVLSIAQGEPGSLRYAGASAARAPTATGAQATTTNQPAGNPPAGLPAPGIGLNDKTVTAAQAQAIGAALIAGKITQAQAAQWWPDLSITAPAFGGFPGGGILQALINSATGVWKEILQFVNLYYLRVLEVIGGAVLVIVSLFMLSGARAVPLPV